VLQLDAAKYLSCGAQAAPMRRTNGEMSQPDTGPAYVFEDRKSPGDWRIEWINDEGDIEVAIFAGPKARERALRYAERQYGRFEEVRFYH